MRKVNEALIDDLLSQLTLEEKIGMIHGQGLFQTAGVPRLGIPPMKMSDGPMGVRNEFALDSWINVGTTDDYVSYLPSTSALASTWNRELAYRTGAVLGAEARGRGKDVILAPGINIKRSPLCGRNFEYMSEDPRLVEEMVVPLIKGIQEYDVAACVKHFAANNQETDRLEVDTYLDERSLREIYFPGFKASIDKGESYTIMGAYNRLYGEYCSQSRFLLTKVLREEWNYDGAVISDWGAVKDTKEAAESGLDIEMSVTSNFDNYYMANPLLKAVKKGKIDEEHIDKKIRNILRTMLRLKMIGEERKERASGTYNDPLHREIILECAEESIILLKNEDNRLPLKKSEISTIGVIGQNAERVHSNGGGSAEIKALYEISPLLGLKMQLGGNATVRYARGYYVPEAKKKELNWQSNSLDNQNINKKEKSLPKTIKSRQEELLQEAVALAKEVEDVIIFAGLDHEYDVEGKDRSDMDLPYGQDRLIQEVLKVNPNAIVVIVGGSPVEMDSWSKDAKAIVWTYYAGMEGGTALAKVLLGKVNPSGKIAESFPKKLMDSPAHKLGEFGKHGKVTYNEGIFVGYRYYDSYNIELEFPFGHGLSYTTFEYKDLAVTIDESDEDDIKVEVKATIKNTGDIPGAEIVQLYVADMKSSLPRPVQELKGFTKLYLYPNEEETFTITLNKESFGFYDEKEHGFVVEPGEFEIRLAASSRDIRLRKTIKVDKKYSY
ncbi:MAG: glycosyl hydrolase [Clostridiales bacterium]|jgi:beta-glucosidase|nr:glycoside hydrolase family 3 C-terminal domain-containing protein [Bacillota bacterium]NLK02989.1 glycosyl hydrolase [Clostridiales bacterium]